MSAASEKAVEHATEYVGAGRAVTEAVLKAAHAPVLGLDRSVCLRDIDEWLDRTGVGTSRRNWLKREFGGEE